MIVCGECDKRTRIGTQAAGGRARRCRICRDARRGGAGQDERADQGDVRRSRSCPRLMKEREYPNVMAVPRLQKVVVNMGVGEATQNIKLLDAAMDELGRITGQSRRSCAARASRSRPSSCARACPSRPRSPCAATACTSSSTACSTWPCRACATSAACPRTPSTAAATTRWACKDQLIFPEVDYAKVDKLRGMNVTFVTIGPHRRGVEAAPPVPRHAVPDAAGGAIVAKTSLIAKAAADAEVRRPQVHALPPLRPPSGLPAEVPALPHLLPPAGARRGHPRRDQGQLVDGPRGKPR